MSMSEATFETPGHKVFLAGPDRMVVTEGGGCVAAVGVAMSLAGVFCVLGGTTSLWGWPPGLVIPGVKWPVGMLVLGIGLLLLGLSSATHRTRTVFDRDNRTWVRTGSILFVFSLNRSGSFDDVAAVHIGRETRSTSGRVGRSTTFTYYPVSVRCRAADGRDLEHKLGATGEHEEAARLAEVVARFLDVPVHEDEVPTPGRANGVVGTTRQG